MLSIIIPVFNGEKYIKKCITMLKNQVLSEFEVIFINDGSFDNTLYLLEKYINNDKRFRIISTKNYGVSHARNVGINESKGDYICFLDCDDIYYPNLCSKLYSEISSNKKIDIIQCSYIEITKQKKVVETRYGDSIIDSEIIRKEIFNDFINNQNYGYYVVWNKIYKKEFILSNNLFFEENRNHGEDWWFNICAFESAKYIKFVKEYLYEYRIHTNSLSTSFDTSYINWFITGNKQMTNFAKKYFLPIEKIKKRYFEQIFDLIYKISINQDIYRKYYYRLLNNEITLNDIICVRLPIKIKIVFLLNKLHLFLLTSLIINLHNKVRK